MGCSAAADEQRHKIALACRVLARAGLVEHVLGHVSAQLDDGSVLVRCRGPHETGLAGTEVDDVRLVDAHGATDDARYTAPNELPIHTVLLERPGVGAVVHAHPPAVVAADLAGAPFVPAVGAYDIPAARLAADGIPVYPRSVLIRRRELAEEMLARMGDRPVCILRGHGITTVGATVEEAVVRALAIDSLARMVSRVASLGGDVVPVPDGDLAELPDLGGGFNVDLMWRFHVHRLAAEGLGLDGDRAGPAAAPGRGTVPT